ncbi:MAG: glycosyltransferase family 2 protein [Thermoplasmata archaeon]|nr:glycosyltransferase family 2 protein [Thermoplasmata archaeon]
MAGYEVAPPLRTYRDYTLERYHRSIDRLARLKWKYAAWMVALTATAVLLFSHVRVPSSFLAAHLQWLTLVWLLPVPLLIWVALVYFVWFRVERFALTPSESVSPTPSTLPTVIFQVTSTGVNVETVLNTVGSVLYWTRHHPELPYRTLSSALIEELGYLANQSRFDRLRADGVELVIVPAAYRTPRGTTRKGRALQFAVEHRRRLGLTREETWIYHQDDETAVGEDTVLGIGEFVTAHAAEKSLGLGIILYPQDADFRPSQIQEFGRSKDDLRTIYTITSPRNKMSGFHGSHFIVRGDVEDETGWDVGPNMLSEDLLFENAVRRQHGPIFHILKGFAYEKAAFTIRDQLRQRRRWVQGWSRALRRERFSPGRRLVMAYSMAVWMGAVVSLLAIVTSWIFGFTPLLPYAGGLAGFVWVTLVAGYHEGYTLHREYVPRRSVSYARVIANGVAGALADALAPWYGLFTRRKLHFEVIQKDRLGVGRPVPLSLPISGAEFRSFQR